MTDLELYKQMKKAPLAPFIVWVCCLLAALAILEFRGPSQIWFAWAPIALISAASAIVFEIRTRRFIQEKLRSGRYSTELLIEITSDFLSNPRSHNKEVWAEKLTNYLSTLGANNLTAENRASLVRLEKHLRMYRIKKSSALDALKERLKETRESSHPRPH